KQLAISLAQNGALAGSSDHGTTKSLYGKDPDGLEFEIAWIVPADQLDDVSREARKQIGRLNLDQEIARYGADTRGGIGISVPIGWRRGAAWLSSSSCGGGRAPSWLWG